MKQSHSDGLTETAIAYAWIFRNDIRKGEFREIYKSYIQYEVSLGEQLNFILDNNLMKEIQIASGPRLN